MLAATDKIELIFQRSGAFRLVLVVEAGEWAHPEALALLEDKVDAAASFALDGQLLEEYPDAKGKPVQIVVRPVDPAPALVLAFIERAAEILSREGLSLTLEPLPAEDEAA